MSKQSDFEFADLSEIELQKIKEVEEMINRKMRVNTGKEVYLMAFTPLQRQLNESGEVHDQKPVYNL